MFSRKKKNYTWLWVCSILAIMIFAVLLLIGSLAGSKDEETLRASLEKSAEQRQEVSESEQEDSYEDGAEENLGKNSAVEKKLRKITGRINFISHIIWSNTIIML